MYETARKSYEQSRIGKAVKYTLPLMVRLGRYVNDGRFCIDNNLVENAVRPADLRRKTSCLAEGQSKPTRIKLTQLGATWINLAKLAPTRNQIIKSSFTGCLRMIWVLFEISLKLLIFAEKPQKLPCC